MSAAEEFRHHNNPPADLLLGEPLREKLTEENQDILDRAELLLKAAGRLPAIDNDDVAGKVGDYIKQLTALIKVAETRRTGAKEPYLEGGRHVDGFFKAVTDPVAKIKEAVGKLLTIYEREKEAAARAKRLAEERAARDAAEKAAAEADAAAAAAADDKSLDDAIAAEKAAEVAAADLAKAAQAADVKPAELSRTRGEYGSMTSLRTEWVFDDLVRADLDLEQLRPYLPTDGLEKAIRAFIKAGGRELKGVRIYESTKAVVR